MIETLQDVKALLRGMWNHRWLGLVVTLFFLLSAASGTPMKWRRLVTTT